MSKCLPASSMLMAVAVTATAAQSFEGAHQIELRLGVWNQLTDVRTEVGAGGVSTTAGGSGLIGGLSYGHWLQEHLALRISAGALAVSVDTDVGAFGVSTETAAVAALLLGIKYYFPRSTYGSAVRPFAGGGVGAFIGSQTQTRTGTVTNVVARTEPAMGGQVNGGVDFVIGRHFLLSAALGINLMTDFAEPIGGSANYSGPELTLGFGYWFGGQ